MFSWFNSKEKDYVMSITDVHAKIVKVDGQFVEVFIDKEDNIVMSYIFSEEKEVSKEVAVKVIDLIKKDNG